MYGSGPVSRYPLEMEKYELRRTTTHHALHRTMVTGRRTAAATSKKGYDEPAKMK